MYLFYFNCVEFMDLLFGIHVLIILEFMYLLFLNTGTYYFWPLNCFNVDLLLFSDVFYYILFKT